MTVVVVIRNLQVVGLVDTVWIACRQSGTVTPEVPLTYRRAHLRLRNSVEDPKPGVSELNHRRGDVQAPLRYRRANQPRARIAAATAPGALKQESGPKW